MPATKPAPKPAPAKPAGPPPFRVLVHHRLAKDPKTKKYVTFPTAAAAQAWVTANYPKVPSKNITISNT